MASKNFLICYNRIMKKEKKEYIEVEVIKDETSKEKDDFKGKAFDYGVNFAEDEFRERVGDLKRGMY